MTRTRELLIMNWILTGSPSHEVRWAQRVQLKLGTIRIMLKQIQSIQVNFRSRWPRTHVNYHQLADSTSTAHTYGLMLGWGDLRPADKEEKTQTWFMDGSGCVSVMPALPSIL